MAGQLCPVVLSTCTGVSLCSDLLPGLWAHSWWRVSSQNTDQLHQLRDSSQVFLQDLLITPSHTVYPLAHQKSQNSIKSFISVKKKRWNSDVRDSDNGDRIWIFEIHKWYIFSFNQRALSIVAADICMPQAPCRALFVLDTEVCSPLAEGPLYIWVVSWVTLNSHSVAILLQDVKCNIWNSEIL